MVSKAAQKTKSRKLSQRELLELKRTEKKIISRLVSSYYTNKVLTKEKTDIIINNFPLAVYIAKKYYRPDYDIQDLVQVAAMGLIKAVKKYRPSMKTRLSHYAIPTIEGEIKHFLRDSFYGIKVSRKCVELNAKLQKYREEYLYKNGKEVPLKDLAKAFKLRIKEVERIIETVRAHSTISLDAPIGSVRGMNRDSHALSRLEDLIGHESKVERMIESEGLHEALRSLNHRDQLIIKDRFIRDLSQEEIARRHEITQAQVSRVIKLACQKMFTLMM